MNPSGNFLHALDLVFFEQWLRFYFIAEEDGELYIRVPADIFEATRKDLPNLFPLAEALNNAVIDHQKALTTLCDNMVSGPYALNGAEWAQILGGEDFQVLLQLMAFWLQAEEDSLDESILPFRNWQSRFYEWKETDQIKDYTARLKTEQGQDTPAPPLQ